MNFPMSCYLNKQDRIADMQFLPIETVVHIVQTKLDSGQFGTVEFVKLDGTIRKANVHFKPLSKMKAAQVSKGNEPATQAEGQLGLSKPNRGGKVGGQLSYISGYEVSTSKWVSFDPSRVLAIK